MSSDPNTVAALLERMEQAGLITRQAHEKDRRAKRLQLQPAGKTKYNAAREIALELQTQILQTLPLRTRNQFLANLETVAEACWKAGAKSLQKQSRRNSVSKR